MDHKDFILIIIFSSGMHHNSDNCDSSQLMLKVQHGIAKALKDGQLYPKNLKIEKIYDEDDVPESLKPNGGWGDLRDILLCLNMTLEIRQAAGAGT